MSFLYLKNNKLIAATLIILLAFSFTPVFAEDSSGGDMEIPFGEMPIEEIVVPVEITTGDAVSVSDTTSAVNTNVEEVGNQENEASNEETLPLEEIPEEIVTETEVSNENEAVVENNVETTAETGDNSASGGGSGSVSNEVGATITTGDSLASANVVNVVNTNIIDSSGFFFLLNALFGQIGTIDVRAAMENNYSEQVGSLTSLCGTNLCNATTTSITTVENKNTAEITNNVIVRSSTGGNSASGDGSTINTGNAYASANVVNVANTNIIDSNYALVVFNNFGNWGGDFILPNADFFDNFFLNRRSDGNGGTGTSEILINNQNEANVENNVVTVADTGDNKAMGGDSEISTGVAVADSNVHNQVNTNLFGGKSFRILFRITGNWNGNIFGAPKGVHWRQTPTGVEIFGDEELSDIPPLGGGTEGGVSKPATTTTEISNENSATIKNNVQVYALTGENEIEGEGGEIQTGDALASANVVNLANTNVVGQNWLYAMFNIFGDWDGNLSFGQPDLWLGVRAESASGGFGPGAQVAYHFTVANRGDADATDVKLKNIFDSDWIKFDNNESEWNIGAVPAGSSVDFTYIATISSDLPFGDTELKGSAMVTSFENDANAEDNSDSVVIIASRPRPEMSQSIGLNVPITPDPILSITKTNDASTTPLTASSTIKYKVVIKNDGGEAYRSVLVDTLKNEKGEIINEQSWDLDVIFPGEEITVDYTVFFNASTTDGVYTNFAQVKALGRHPSLDPFYGWFADSNIATSSITITNPKLPEPVVELTVPEVPTAPALTTEEIKREVKPIIKPSRETNTFPPLQSFVPFDPDFFGKMVFVSRPDYDLSQTAAVFAGLPFAAIPRGLNILALIILGTFFASSNRLPIRKIRRALTSFLS